VCSQVITPHVLVCIFFLCGCNDGFLVNLRYIIKLHYPFKNIDWAALVVHVSWFECFQITAVQLLVIIFSFVAAMIVFSLTWEILWGLYYPFKTKSWAVLILDKLGDGVAHFFPSKSLPDLFWCYGISASDNLEIAMLPFSLIWDLFLLWKTFQSIHISLEYWGPSIHLFLICTMPI
jgi:hypothetical protein